MTLTKREATTLAKLLKKAEPPFPENVFNAWCENFTTNPMELAVLDKTEEKVLFIPRPLKDKYYPGQPKHMPGSVKLPGERIQKVLRRIVKNEVGAKCSAPVFVDWEYFAKGKKFHQNVRGEELSLLFICKLLKGIPKHGKFHSLKRAPKNTLGTHRIMLKKVRKFVERMQMSRFT